MGLAALYFTCLVVFGTYTYTFKEDFSKETLEKMSLVAICLAVLIVLFNVLL